MLVTKMVKTVTNILKLSPTHFVSNIRHQHRCSPNIRIPPPTSQIDHHFTVHFTAESNAESFNMNHFNNVIF